jgi:NAD dependent epimerase/dehydratase family enzyme
MHRLFERALRDERMTGAYIATAPNPVSNSVFMRELRSAVGAPFGLPAAGWMVRLAAPIRPLRATLRLATPARGGLRVPFSEIREALRDLWVPPHDAC